MSEQDEHGNFPWESPVPTGPFWTSLPETIGRQALRVWPAAEMAALDLDGKASLPNDNKLRLLLSLVQAINETHPLGPPEALDHHSFQEIWHRREYLAAHLERDLGGPEHLAAAELRCRRMIPVWAARDDPDKKWAVDMGTMDMLLVVLRLQGRLAESAEAAAELLAAIEVCPVLGVASPMYLGILLKQVETYVRMGRADEAKALLALGWETLDVLAGSRFAKYEERFRGDLEKAGERIITAEVTTS